MNPTTPYMYFENTFLSLEPMAKELCSSFNYSTLKLQTSRDQEEFKKMVSYLTEEIFELYEAVLVGKSTDHIKDEIADIMGFMYALVFMADFSLSKIILDLVNSDPHYSYPNFILRYGKNEGKLWSYTFASAILPGNSEILGRLKNNFWEFMYQIKMVCNILKNRRWKSSQFLLDLGLFQEKFRDAMRKGFIAIVKTGYNQEEIHELFIKKFETNIKRIKTGY